MLCQEVQPHKLRFGLNFPVLLLSVPLCCVTLVHISTYLCLEVVCMQPAALSLFLWHLLHQYLSLR